MVGPRAHYMQARMARHLVWTFLHSQLFYISLARVYSYLYVTSGSRKTVSAAVAAGSSIAGIVLGALIGLVAGWLFLYYRKRERRPYPIGRGSKTSLAQLDEMPTPGLSSYSDYSRVPLSPGHEFGGSLSGSSAGPSTTSSRLHHAVSQYHIEPFIPPGTDGPDPTTPVAAVTSDGRQSPSQSHNRVVSGGSTAEAAASGAGHGRQSTTQGQQVYVVHHDGGRAPVTVYTADGTEVVELPPSYIASREVGRGPDTGRPGSDSSEPTRGAQRGPEAMNQRRMPNAPRKQPRSS
jgi:hypothetical protein